jgi:hypothetical protein
MTVYIFTGPTLSAERGRAEIEAVFLPPCGQGDVYRAALRQPRAIGIIDGYFERVPAVWHKEILWAMSRGVHVFGAASMGALRAAELAPFGMRGVGVIYERMRSGELEDDDEVAVAHGSADSGYRALSEAMVNIRATLAAAEARGVIDAGHRAELENVAKGLFYAERSYPALWQRAAERGMAGDRLAALVEFVSEHRVDQKRVDALALLAEMSGYLAGNPGRKRVTYAFEHTDAWEQLVIQMDREEATGAAGSEDVGGVAAPVSELIDELALAGEYEEARREALLRALALDAADRQRMVPEGDMLRAAAGELGQRHGLASEDAVQAWLEQQGMQQDGLDVLLAEEAKLAWVATVYAPMAERALRGHLRVQGRYHALVERAQRRRALLARAGLEAPTLADAGVTEDELWAWYFHDHRGRDIPADMSAYARRAGFGDPARMRRAVLRAYCCARLQRTANDQPETPAGHDRDMD